MSQLQEIIHRTSHLAFESGRLSEQNRVLKYLKDAKQDATQWPSIPAYVIIRELERLIRQDKNG
jgi:hypothetical protein